MVELREQEEEETITKTWRGLDRTCVAVSCSILPHMGYGHLQASLTQLAGFNGWGRAPEADILICAGSCLVMLYYRFRLP